MIHYASMNGVELRNLTELDFEEPLYSADIYIDGKEAGSLREQPESEMVIDLVAAYKPVVNARISDYLAAVADEGEKLPVELFFLDLIQLELYLQLFRQAQEEGNNALVACFGEDQADAFAVADEEEAMEVVRAQGVEQFQIFLDEEDFVISC